MMERSNKEVTEDTVPLVTELGICEPCHKVVYSNRLHVWDNEQVYHLSCYNELKKADKDVD